jgi:hypothetical protein
MRPTTSLLLLSTVLAGCQSATGPETAVPGSRGSATIVGQVVSLQLTFHEPVIPQLKRGVCPVAPEGFCGAGEVIPFGNATETIEFGAACGGSCDLRTIQLPQGSITLQETFSNPACPGSCHRNPAEPVNGTLTDVVTGGTGLFQRASGVLNGTVKAAGPESIAKLSGTLILGR